MGQQTSTVEAQAAVGEPLLISIAEAERLCSLPKNAGYQLARTDWADFVVRYGIRDGGIRVNRAKLLAWINGESTAA